MLTAYFYDPSKICQPADQHYPHAHAIHFQKGDSYKPENLIKVPATWSEAESDDYWHMDNYFLGMGHHVTRAAEKQRDDCTTFFPFQALYAAGLTVTAKTLASFSSTHTLMQKTIVITGDFPRKLT